MSLRAPSSLVVAASIWVIAFWIICVGIPIGVLLGRLDGPLLVDPGILSLARLTALQAGISALGSAIMGLPLGLWIGAQRKGERGGFFAELFLALPFSVPTVVAALAWVMILGRNGMLAHAGVSLDWAYSLRAVILAHVFFNAPWIALLVAQSRQFVSESHLEAARLLGASRWARLRFIEWPVLKWSFLSAVTQAFGFCSMSFALVLILGGGPPVETLETALYAHLRFGSLDLDGAIACAVWELLITLLPWMLVLFFEARADRTRERTETQREPGAWGKFTVGRPLVAAFFFAPYLVTLAGNGWRRITWLAWQMEIFPAMKVSAELAFFSATLAVLTAVAAVVALSSFNTGEQSSPSTREGKRSSNWRSSVRLAATILLSLPGGVSVLVLGLGLWLAYGRWIDPFEGSLLAMVALQGAVFFNLAFRIFWPLARRFQLNLLEAATTLGASPFHAFCTVEWPRWRSAVTAAFALVAAASCGEVAAVSLFQSQKLITLPLLVSRWSTQYRFEEARAVAGLLLGLSAGTIAMVFLARRYFLGDMALASVALSSEYVGEPSSSSTRELKS
jgi:thiamine transport system permease protein